MSDPNKLTPTELHAVQALVTAVQNGRSRGWKAKEEKGMKGDELDVFNYVRVNGRKKERK